MRTQHKNKNKLTKRSNKKNKKTKRTKKRKQSGSGLTRISHRAQEFIRGLAGIKCKKGRDACVSVIDKLKEHYTKEADDKAKKAGFEWGDKLKSKSVNTKLCNKIAKIKADSSLPSDATDYLNLAFAREECNREDKKESTNTFRSGRLSRLNSLKSM